MYKFFIFIVMFFVRYSFETLYNLKLMLPFNIYLVYYYVLFLLCILFVYL